MKRIYAFILLMIILIISVAESGQISFVIHYDKSYQEDCLCPGDGHSGYTSFSSMFSRDTKMFNDPVPMGNIVTGIDVTLYGTACAWGAPEKVNGNWIIRKYPGTVPFRFELNNSLINESQFSGTCKCDDCSAHSLSKSDPGGLPEYIYGGINAFDVIKPWKLGPEKLFVKKVEITLHYIQGTAPQGPWTQKFPATSPSARFGHVMSYIGGDKVLMFGGWDALNNETWLYDKSMNKWTNLTPLINTAVPSPRYKTDMAYIGKDRVLLFGGVDDNLFDNETWLFDLSDLTWTKLNPVTGLPVKRFYHSMAYLGDDQVLMFGGSGVLQFRNDTWIFDLSENKWTETALSGPKPANRFRQAMARIDYGKALMFGGGTLLNDYNDTWLFDKTSGQWQNPNPPSPLPSARKRLDMAYIGEDMVLMFGGNSALGFEDDTWVFDLSDNAWTINPYPPHPSARQIHAMAYLGGYMALLFGGDAESSLAGKDDETWIYNDTGEEPIDPPYADDLALWLNPHSLQGMDNGDPVDLWEDSAPVPAQEDATIADNKRIPQYRNESNGIHGSPGVEFVLDYTLTGYGLSDILACPYHQEITSGHADRWSPVAEDKSLFIVFQTGTKIDDSGEELPYYSNGNQVIFETGGPLSGMNMYISNGKLCFGMWNRFEQRFLVFDPADGSDLYPLDPEEVYLANLEYNAATKRFRAIVNTRSGNIPVAASPLVDFRGLTKENDLSGVGGAARTRFHNFSTGETYSHHFGGKIADLMLYNEFFDMSGSKNPQQVYDFLNDRYMDFDGLVSGFFYPGENLFPQPKEKDWKVISYDQAPGKILSNVLPNPVEETATFGLQLQSEENVNIKIYDALGSEIINLYSGILPAGFHNFPIDASNMAGGIYIIKVVGESFTETTKMIVFE